MMLNWVNCRICFETIGCLPEKNIGFLPLLKVSDVFRSVQSTEPNMNKSSDTLIISPPKSTKCASENSAVQAQTPPWKGGIWAGTSLFSISLAHTHMITILLIYYFLCFLKASMILDMKVVPNDTFKSGSERVIALPMTASNRDSSTGTFCRSER